jgi:hypothetical protein
MNQEVYEAGFVSTTILQLYGEVSKITGANNIPDLRSIVSGASGPRGCFWPLWTARCR